MKRRYLTLGSLLLVAGILAIWWFGYHGVHPRLIVWPPPAEIPPPAALDEPAELSETPLPLADVLSLLSERHGVPIEIDSFAQKSTGVIGSTPISLRLSGVSLKSLLSHIAREVGLVVRTRGGTVYLTTDADWTNNKSNFTARVYPLDKLLAGPHLLRESDLAEVVEQCLAKVKSGTTYWSAGECRAYPGALVVSQTPDVQARVARLLEVLADVCAAPDSVEPIWLDPPSARTEEICVALARPGRLALASADLEDLAEQMTRVHGIGVVQDRALLGFDRPRPDKVVALQSPNPSLGAVLSAWLELMGLVFTVEDDAIVISKPSGVEERVCTRIYPIADLLDIEQGIDEGKILESIDATEFQLGGLTEFRCLAGCLIATHTRDGHEKTGEFLADLRRALRAGQEEPFTRSTTDAEGKEDRLVTRCYRVLPSLVPNSRRNYEQGDDGDPLVSTIYTTLRPQAWPRGPRVSAESRASRLGNALIATQTRSMHDLLGSFLKSLDQMEHGPSHASPVWVWAPTDDHNPQVEEALARQASMEFDHAELADVAESLAQEHGIPVRLDVSILDSEIPRQRITCNYRGITLRLGLQLILRDLELVFEERRGILWIGKSSFAPPRVKTRLYDVRDLADSIGVEEFIARVIAPKSWDRDCAVRQLGGVLVVSQTADAHREIEKLLTLLRRSPTRPVDLSPLVLDESELDSRVEIEARLTRRSNFNIAKQPLGDILKQLADQHRFILAIDLGAVLEVELDEQIAYEAENVTLVEALTSLLPADSFEWRFYDNVLFVTSPKVATAPVITRLYPISHFLTDRPPPHNLTREELMPFVKWGFHRLPGSTSGSHFPPRDHAFQNTLDTCLAGLAPEWPGTLDWEFYGDFLAVSTNRCQVHANLAAILEQLRELIDTSKPAGEAGSRPESSGKDVMARLALFDLRSLLDQYPELTAGELRDWVGQWLGFETQFSVSPEGVRRTARDVFAGEAWSGILVAPCVGEDSKTIDAALSFLADLPADLPRPGEVLRPDNARGIERLREFLGRETEPYRLRYVVWLAGQLKSPPREIVNTLAAWLYRDDFYRDRVRNKGARRAFARFGPAGATAAPAVESLVASRSLDETFRRRWAETLVNLGPDGVARLCKIAAAEPSDRLIYGIVSKLQGSPSREAGVAALLPLFCDSTSDQTAVLNIIAVMDTNGSASRRALARWRREAESRDRLLELDEMERALKSRFGERRK